MDTWQAKRQAVLSTIWADGAIPTNRTVPDSVEPHATLANVSWLVWDISADGGVAPYPMNATAWYHPIRADARSRAVILMHCGHDLQDDGVPPRLVRPNATVSAWVHGTLELDYIYLWMPLYGANQQHGYPPHHGAFFPQWQAAGVRTLRYFLEPAALAVNYALSTLGYEAAYMAGLSGGGWTTTVYAAIDPRVPISLPLAGSLPWYLFPDHQQGDYEQRPQPGVSDWYLSQANFTELYVLAALEPGRVSVQVLHEDDPCCFHGRGRHDTILGYDRRVAAVLSSLRSGGGGVFSTAISDWNVHEWDNRSRSIVAAALREAIARPRAPRLDRLPCDILQHAPDAVPCPAGVSGFAAG